MATQKKGLLDGAIPSITEAIRLEERFKDFDRESRLAQLGAEMVGELVRTLRKELKALVKGQVTGQKLAAGAVLDQKALHADMANDLKGIGARLKKLGLKNEVAEARKKHRDTLDFANALVKLAQTGGLAGDAVLKPLFRELTVEQEALSEAETRKSVGGHPGFDPKTTAQIRRAWVLNDASYDLLAACCRLEGVVDDPVLAARPKQRVPGLRFELSSPPPAHPRRRPGPKPGSRRKKGGPGGDKGSSNPPPAT